ncbi:MAG: sce7726 family protein [Planctomycetaceae bacterium]|nr:sce7726 family protein [Planctomycetaceae bacterium]
MNDKQIRPLLLELLRSRDPLAAIFEELPICRGDGRADVVSVNGAMYGYEIKGSNDTTRRLSKQIVDYERVFDYCVIVATQNHLDRAREIVPLYWGIVVVHETNFGPTMKQVRAAKRNRHTDPEAIMRLMWRREAVKSLRRCGISIESTALISHVWDVMVKAVSPKTIADEVRTALKARGGYGFPVM